MVEGDFLLLLPLLLLIVVEALDEASVVRCKGAILAEEDDEEVGFEDVGLLILRAREAGGPTGTRREPNSTPMVTSC